MQNATPKHRQIKRTLFTICAILLMFRGIPQIQAQFESRRGGFFRDGADRLERAGLKIGMHSPDIIGFANIFLAAVVVLTEFHF